jgi:hypothetical protein
MFGQHRRRLRSDTRGRRRKKGREFRLEGDRGKGKRTLGRRHVAQPDFTGLLGTLQRGQGQQRGTKSNEDLATRKLILVRKFGMRRQDVKRERTLTAPLLAPPPVEALGAAAAAMSRLR